MNIVEYPSTTFDSEWHQDFVVPVELYSDFGSTSSAQTDADVSLEPVMADVLSTEAAFGGRIASIPGVCGGDPCISGTRITVWGLEQSRRAGLGAEDILENYPALTAAEVWAAWNYAAFFKDEIDRQIEANEEA